MTYLNVKNFRLDKLILFGAREREESGRTGVRVHSKVKLDISSG